MAENYILLERVELNASAASISFNNIPQSGYTDLKIVVSARSASATDRDQINLNFNGLTTNQSYRILYGIPGVATGSESGSKIRAGYISGNSSTASTFGSCDIYIPNYTSANAKSVSADGVSETNASPAGAQIGASLWNSTAAITSIVIVTDSGSNFLANSTFSLYGIAAVGTTPAIAPKASGGNVIDYDGTYWIHTFTSSGTFTPQTGLTCDYLVVAGGGGTGENGAGGGGAGGLRSTVTATGGGGTLESALALTASTNYTVTIGAGGTGGTNAAATNGVNSVFSTITSSGGGGSQNFVNGANGGSGSGAHRVNTVGLGTANQGRNGAQGLASGGSNGGGGGGSSTAGSASTGTDRGGNGGAGVATVISGTSVTYAGGGGGGGNAGGGGTGGAGGGGNGGAGGASGTAGTVNTGGGGGGGGQNPSTGGAGGSGIVIIRYPAA
jgi:hypothetical protein